MGRVNERGMQHWVWAAEGANQDEPAGRMNSVGIGPCAYPRCDDGHGNATLTTQTICDHCRNRYRNLLDWIALDYLHLLGLPKPVRIEDQVRSSNARVYGHPGEWASDLRREIAQAINWAEHDLRDVLDDGAAPHPFGREAGLVAHGHRYLTNRMDQLCTKPGAGDTAEELEDLHAKARRGLGQTQFVQRLPTPCPTCDVVSLTRRPGSGTDQIDCASCGRVILPEHYGLLTRVVLDDLIDEYEAQHQ